MPKPLNQSISLFYGLLIVWFFLNLIQSAFTELIHDEAYYYYYSTQLAWGYFDHPPMIALWIKLGSWLFKGELGVRIITCVGTAAGIVLLMKISRVKNYLLFLAVVSSVVILNIAGIIAVPDLPMFFFSVFFLWAYKRYLEQDSVLNSVLIIIGIVGLLYSKYLGVLLIFFTFISYPSIIRRKSSWAILLLSALAMVPHLIWQINHDFVTVRFHLFERGLIQYFKFKNISDYLLGQIGIINPLIAFILIYYAIRHKAEDRFERALQFNAVGIYLFAFLLTLKSPVEANWSVAAILPLIVLGYREIEKNLRIHKTVYLLSIISLMLFGVLRMYMMWDFLPGATERSTRNEFHGWDRWAEMVAEVADGRPVVVANSYQKASKYYYYGAPQSFSFTYGVYRKSQFDTRDVEQSLQGKEVFYVSGSYGMYLYPGKSFFIPIDGSLEQENGEPIYYSVIEYYRSFDFVPVEFEFEQKSVAPSSLISIPVKIINPMESPMIFTNEAGPTYLTASFMKRGQIISYQESLNLTDRKVDGIYETRIEIRTPAQTGTYVFRLGIQSGYFPPGLNSTFVKIKVQDSFR